jgi:hypothetical protein
MHKELHSIRIIRDYMAKKNLLPQNVNNIESIYSFFQYLSSEDSKKKFNLIESIDEFQIHIEALK